MSGEVPLRTRNLSRSFGLKRVLRGVDITVDKGHIYGFLGRNGAGKTTTLRVVMGLLWPTGGRVELFGRTLKGADRAARRRIGFVSQEQHFYSWMTIGFLGRFVGGFYPTWDQAEFNRLLDVLDLSSTQFVGTLSVGMRRKLALGLALSHRPELLLLDEPTAGLDPVARRQFLEMVRRHARDDGRTTLFSTHRVDEAKEFADTIGIIDDGRMLLEGSKTELMATVRHVDVEHQGDARRHGFERLDAGRDEYGCAWKGPVDKWALVRNSALPLERVFLAITGARPADF